jgi:uncharacterized protein (TIGR00251 family)
LPGSPGSSWFRATGTGLALHLRVTPNAGRDAIEGVEQRADGTSALRLRVKAVPDKGKANAAAIALLAKALGLPKSSLSLVSGQTSRFKTVEISGDSAALGGLLAGLVSATRA